MNHGQKIEPVNQRSLLLIYRMNDVIRHMVLATVGMRSPVASITFNIYPAIDILQNSTKQNIRMASGFAIVTPASRGLGFAFARQLLAKTNLPVIATARRDCDKVRSELINDVPASQKADERLHVFKADVTGKLHTYPLSQRSISKEPPR